MIGSRAVGTGQGEGGRRPNTDVQPRLTRLKTVVLVCSNVLSYLIVSDTRRIAFAATKLAQLAQFYEVCRSKACKRGPDAHQ